MAFALKHRVNIRTLPPNGTMVRLEADEGMRLQLAHNHNLLRVDSFVGVFQLTPLRGDKINLSGHIVSDIVQRCVVSADVLTTCIETPINVIFMPQISPFREKNHTDRKNQRQVESFLDVTYDDHDIEFFSGDSIDIGALAEEFFELAIDPYPRKKGEKFSPSSPLQDETQNKNTSISPFAILKRLK